MNMCLCVKLDGKRCTRESSKKAGQNTQFCWQHQNCKSIAPHVTFGDDSRPVMKDKNKETKPILKKESVLQNDISKVMPVGKKTLHNEKKWDNNQEFKVNVMKSNENISILKNKSESNVNNMSGETYKHIISKSPELNGYTVSQIEKFEKLSGELQKKTINELKNMLSRNDQSASGNKDELIRRVADGIMLGKIARCVKCDGGRPKFDSKSGIYTCPGYYTDEGFKKCGMKYTNNQLPREKWQN